MKVSLPTLISNSKSPKVTSMVTSPKWQNQISGKYSQSVQLSLDKSIRGNNVHSILGRSKISYNDGFEADDIENEEKKDVIHNFNQIRKKINEVAQQCTQKLKATEKLKGELERMVDKDNCVREQNQQDHSSIEDMKMALSYQKMQTEEAMVAHDAYVFMLERLKKDKLCDEMKIAKLEKVFTKKYRELSQNLRKVRSETQFHNLAKNFVKEVEAEVDDEIIKRQKNLLELETNLIAKEEHEVEREKRTRHIQEVAELAAQEVGNEVKQYQELLLTHKFVKAFMKSKIDRQLEHFEQVEKAYQKIKAATGLTDLTEITAKFLNREEKYSELLISIADSERKVNEAKKINETLKAKVKVIKDENSQLDKVLEERNTSKGFTAEIQKEMNIKEGQYKQTNFVLENSHKWALRTLARIDKAQNVMKNNYDEIYPKDKFTDIFLQIITSVKSSLDQLKEKPDETPLFNKNVETEEKYNDFMLKNIRVRPNQTEMSQDVSKADSFRINNSSPDGDLE